MDATADIARAVAALAAGEVIGLPTETVYGLAGDASNPRAVARIFALKGRPADHPVIVHLASAADMGAWAHDIPAAAHDLAAAFWPGPLTLIVKRAPHVLVAVTGGQDTVGLRVPSHPLAQAVLAGFAAARTGRPAGVAAPSANQFGRVSPTTAAHVREEFGAGVELVLDGGACEVGIESTIVDCSGANARVLRPGRISRDMLASVATLEEDVATPAPRVSGSLDKHYAPRTRILLVPRGGLDRELDRHAGRTAVLSRARPARAMEHWAAADDPRTFARQLYAVLREMDRGGFERMLIEAPPDDPAWEGVRDRLRRAAAGSGVPD